MISADKRSFTAMPAGERAIIRERINAGLVRAREKGTRSGKPGWSPRRWWRLVEEGLGVHEWREFHTTVRRACNAALSALPTYPANVVVIGYRIASGHHAQSGTLTYTRWCSSRKTGLSPRC